MEIEKLSIDDIFMFGPVVALQVPDDFDKSAKQATTKAKNRANFSSQTGPKFQ